MTDKVQKIKDWISKEKDGLMDAQGNFEYPEHEGAYHILCNLDTYIDSFQEEPIYEDLEEASIDFAAKEAAKDINGNWTTTNIFNAFKAGAQWQKEKKEPISDDLEETMQHNAPDNIGIDDLLYWRNGFKAGANWQKEQMMTKAVDTK